MVFLFSKRVAQAVTTVVTCLATGTLLGTLVLVFELFTLTVKIYAIIGVNLLAGVCYLTLELLLKKNKL